MENHLAQTAGTVPPYDYEAHATEFTKLSRIPVLKARRNADLHMAKDLKNTGKVNLFVIFGEPDIDLRSESDAVCVKINGVDVFHPNTVQVRSDGADGIACWFIDTDDNEGSFFVRHEYFLGGNERLNPFRALRSVNGELMQIAKVEMVTFHGWMHLGRAMPTEAVADLRHHVKNLTADSGWTCQVESMVRVGLSQKERP